MTRAFELRLLGGFGLRGEAGRGVPVALRKGRALLAYLACAPDMAASRDALSDLLWGDHDHAHARQSLRQLLYKLGHTLTHHGVELLHGDGDIVELQSGVLRVDAHDFMHLTESGTVAELAHAASLYRGPFLAGLNVAAPVFEDWLSVMRARCHETALKCLVRLMKRYRRTGQTAAAITAAHRGLEIDPCREDIHRRLMEIYAEKGMRATALRQYQRCCDVLSAELGVLPDRATVALYRRIATGNRGDPSGLGRLPTRTRVCGQGASYNPRAFGH